ncbi:MAG: PLP-dependent aspartate aminotransferase family protein [Acidobacteriota bacterium]
MKLSPDAAAFGTRSVHVGHDPSDRPEDLTGAVTAPIYQTSTYVQPELGLANPDYEYGRVQNPTRSALERNLASLEGGASAHAFASGMAAVGALMTVLEPGDEVVMSRDVYGGTTRLFRQVLSRYGIRFNWVATRDLDALRAAFTPATRMVYLETPSNPMMEITDIAGAASLAHEHNALCVVDNTFMSPWGQQPLALGADLVLHSTTKYLNGHSDALGGVLIVAQTPHAGALAALAGLDPGGLGAHFAFQQKAAGAILAPMEAFLLMRGIRTLDVRMARHESNGTGLAVLLDARADGRVYYPGLPDHPGHAVHAKQTGGRSGGMIAVDLGDRGAARAFIEALQVFLLAESLGGVESLVSHPLTMTHASVPPELRKELGITDGLVRLSVGIEAYEDLHADIERGLDAVAAYRAAKTQTPVGASVG